VPCSASRVVPGAHRVVGPGTHRGSGPREVHTTGPSPLLGAREDKKDMSRYDYGTGMWLSLCPSSSAAADCSRDGTHQQQGRRDLLHNRNVRLLPDIPRSALRRPHLPPFLAGMDGRCGLIFVEAMGRRQRRSTMRRRRNRRTGRSMSSPLRGNDGGRGRGEPQSGDRGIGGRGGACQVRTR
jgi:hypothetical protein